MVLLALHSTLLRTLLKIWSTQEGDRKPESLLRKMIQSRNLERSLQSSRKIRYMAIQFRELRQNVDLCLSASPTLIQPYDTMMVVLSVSNGYTRS